MWGKQEDHLRRVFEGYGRLLHLESRYSETEIEAVISHGFSNCCAADGWRTQGTAQVHSNKKSFFVWNAQCFTSNTARCLAAWLRSLWAVGWSLHLLQINAPTQNARC